MATASNLLFDPDPVRTPEPDEPVQQSAAVDFPCSVAQERFWLLDRLEPGNPSYNVAVRWQLSGTINVELLERVWCEIIARHEVLRTRFLEVDGKPVQRVSPASAFQLGVTDLSSLAPDASAEEADRIGRIEAAAPFDLQEGPLLRVVLLQCAAKKAIILVTSHQIVTDGWSIGVMAREMGTLYQALALGIPPELEPLPIQYGDYARWQLEWLRQRGTAVESAYWTRQLAGVPPFEITADRPRPAVPTTNGAIASRVLPRELTDGLRELTAEAGVTMFAAAVTALSAVLARYSGKTEIVMGTQVSDRDQVELEPMIGQFVNSLILRLRVDGDPRFTQLLARTSATVSEALEHRNIPIESLLGMIKAGRGGGTSPAVSVNFIFQRTFIEDQDYGELRLMDLPSLPAGAIYDLNFFMIERPAGWRFSCQYNTDQFDAGTVERLLSYVQAAMESAVSSPARRVSELRLADPAERKLLESQLEGGQHGSAPGVSTVGEMITAQASATPKAIALEAHGKQLTYAQLERESDRVALLLRSRGVQAGARVALALPRSPELAVAILGTWKAGAAYIVLDCNATAEQTRQLAAAAGATSTIYPHDLGDDPPTATATASRGPAATHPAAAVWPSPGENGAPVAVEVSHAALLNVLHSLRDRLQLTAAHVFLSSGAVDAQRLTIELFLPLIHGARCVLVAADDTSFCERLAHATTVTATPGNCALLLEHVRDERKIPTILCDRTAFGGTTWARLIACSDELWALQSYPAASGVVSVNRLRQAHDARFLGPPLTNTRFRVLDPNLTATPIDAFGELCIGGNLSAACSPANAESERWIYVPGGSGGDDLLFRTGDAARIRPDGRVEIAGRQAGFEVPAPQAPSPLSKDSLDPQLEGQLQQIWAELLGLQVGSIDVHANFFELGGHSLLAARMLTRVEAQCGRRVALAALFRAPSIRGLARLLRADAREFDFRQVVKLQADGANTPLIAINNTGIFYVLAKRLGPQQPVTSLQIFDPATKRSGLPQTLEEVAAEYVGLIRRTQPHGPYVLAGWCIAGALAFEIGRQLHAAGAQVRQLILIDSWVPGYFSRLPLPHRLIGRFSLRWQLARDDLKRFRSGQHTWPQFIERRVTLRAVWRLWQSLTRHSPGGSGEAAATAQELHDKWLLDYLQSLTDRYVPKSYSGHITLLRSTREPTGWLFDPLAGWGRFARARGVTLEMIEGDHFTMFQDPGASQMASRLAPLIGTP